jgi:hypothetical protein
MRIGVFHNASYYLRYYGTALTALSDRGHELLLARPDRFDEVGVPGALRKRDRVSTALYPGNRQDGLEQSIRFLRAARDFARYQAPELRAAHANRRRSFERLLRTVVGKARSLAFEGDVPAFEYGEDDWSTLDRLFRDLESLIPPDERIRTFLRDCRLDVVVSISRINIAARENELIKAARSLDLPTGVVVYSWDNLSSKGMIHEPPDRLFVWNQVQADEARRLHGIDPARVEITGAVRFDPVFERSPSAARPELLAELGLDRRRTTLLYLGSSSFVAPREPELVDRWLGAVRASGDQRIRDANVIVRPHPGTAADPVWRAYAPVDERAVVTPPVVRERAQDLFDQLWASDAVVGLNTSAEIEAAIVGRPVLTIKVGDLAPGQEGSVHFRYLLAEEGGFVETADGLDEHLEQLGRALGGDPLADARRRFLESFVRPLGLGRPAGGALAAAIEELANERPARRSRKSTAEPVG